MKICHVITRMIVGGAQENTLLTVRGLMERGHDVVLVTGPSVGPEGKLLERFTVPGLKLVENPYLVRDLNPLMDWRAYRSLLAYFRDNGFEVVHTHSSKAGIVGRLAARRAGVPLVIHTVHGQPFHPYQAWWRNRLYILAERLAARSSDRIFAVAQAMIAQCVKAKVAPREKYLTVYSGMELEVFRTTLRDPELRARLGIPPEVPVIGKIARMFELKGHDILIATATRIVKEFPEARFLLVGDGMLRSSLEQQILRQGLNRNFVFAGLVSPAEIPRYTAQMDILAHFSLREGLPRTVVQALATGIPAVGFDLDGTPEVLMDGRTGFICRAGDTAGATEALLKLLRNPQLASQLGHNGQALVHTRFDWRHMVSMIEAEYLSGLRLKTKRGIL